MKYVDERLVPLLNSNPCFYITGNWSNKTTRRNT